MNKPTVSRRLLGALKRRRHTNLQIEAFNRVAKAIEPFDEKTQRRALHANLILAAKSL